MEELDFPEIPIPTRQPGKQRMSWKGYEESKQQLIELAARSELTAKQVEEHYGLARNQIAVWKQNAKNFLRHKEGTVDRDERPAAKPVPSNAGHRIKAAALALREGGADGPSISVSGSIGEPPSATALVEQLAQRRQQLLEERETIDREIQKLDRDVREAIRALESLMRRQPGRGPERTDGDDPEDEG